MVRAQAMLLDHLGIDSLFSVAGGSMGGMQVLQWTASYPERVFSALPIAAATRHSAQNIAFHEVGRQAIMADPEWCKGRYFTEGRDPRKGLAVARMGAHITYLSDAALHRKFGRRFQDRDNPTFSFDADFQVESYLRHQGISFVERFDANSYLYLTRAMDYFDLAADYGGVLANAWKQSPTRFCVISFTSDWLFPTVGIARHRACAQCRRRTGLVRRDRHRQGPRRLPARRAGAVCDRARLPRWRGAGARPSGGAATMMLSRLKRDLTMADAARTPGGARVDLLVVADMVEHGAKVLDIGCGDGELLRLLAETRNVDGRGIELSREGVNEGVAKGLAVIQGDADTDLSDYPNDAFDYVILSQTLQATRQPRVVLEHMLRIGRHAIVSFPNFGHWRIRLQILLGGHMPRTDNLPYAWWESPNIHFCTIKDFRELCDVVGAKMEKSVALNAWGSPIRLKVPWWFWNLFGEQAVFLLSRAQRHGNGAKRNARRKQKRTPRRHAPLGVHQAYAAERRGISGGWDRPARLDS